MLAVATLLRSPQHRTRRLAILRETVDAVVDDPLEQVRVMLPTALAEVWKEDAQAATELLRAWAERASETGWTARDLPRLLLLIDLTDPELAADLVARMLRGHHASVRHTGGSLAVVLQLRAQHKTDTQLGSQPEDPRWPRNALLGLALDDASARAGVAAALANLVEELTDDLQDPTTVTGSDSSPRGPAAVTVGGAAGVPTPGRRLLVRLLDDNDPAVRSAAMQFGRSLKRPLVEYSTLLTAIARTRGFADKPESLLHALDSQSGGLPDAVLELCNRFLDEHGAEVADIQARASASAREVTEFVLALHAQSAAGSAMRTRCLNLIDRLVTLRVDMIYADLETYER